MPKKTLAKKSTGGKGPVRRVAVATTTSNSYEDIRQTGSRPTTIRRTRTTARKSTGGLAPRRSCLPQRYKDDETSNSEDFQRFQISSNDSNSSDSSEETDDTDSNSNIQISNVTGGVDNQISTDTETSTETVTCLPNQSNSTSSTITSESKVDNDTKRVVLKIRKSILSRLSSPFLPNGVKMSDALIIKASDIADIQKRFKPTPENLHSVSTPEEREVTRMLPSCTVTSESQMTEQNDDPETQVMTSTIADSTSEVNVQDVHFTAASSTTLTPPPPATPGHSRWLNETDKRPSEESESIDRPRKKKKNFPPILPPLIKMDKEEPEIIVEKTKHKMKHKKIEQIRKSFAKFQDVRRLLANTQACSTFHGFVHLNAVEQMLINLYNETKNRLFAPVITIDSNDGPIPIENEQTEQNSRLPNVQNDLIPVLAKNEDGQWMLTISGKNLQENLSFRMNELLSNESIVSASEQSLETTTKVKTTNSIDETIDSVLSRAVQPSSTDQELVAQLSSNDSTQTLSQLIQMGFGTGKQNGVSLLELKQIVEECEGRLDRCLNKLTKLA